MREAHTEVGCWEESESVWCTEKAKRRGRRKDTRRVGDRARAESWTGDGGGGRRRRGRENFLGLPLRALSGNQAGRRQVVRADNGAEECGTWD